MSSNIALAQQTARALFWRAAQLAGVKGLFFVRLLILARLLTPDDFGLLAIAVVTLGVFLKLSELGMMPALIQRENVHRSHYDTAWTIGLLRAAAIALIVYAAAPSIALWFAEPRVTVIVRVLALQPLLESAASIRVATLHRGLHFDKITMLGIVTACTDLFVAIILAPLLGVWALVIGALSGAAAGSGVSYFLAPYVPRFRLDRASMHGLMSFGRWIFFECFISLAGSTLLQSLISRRLGAGALGIYFLAVKIAYLPSEIATQVVGSVAFPIYGMLQSDLKQAARVFRILLLGTSFLLVPVYVCVIALSPALVHTLGGRWTGSSPVIQLLAAAGILGLLGDCVGPTLQGLGRPSRVTSLVAAQYIILVAIAWSLPLQAGLSEITMVWIPATAAAQIFAAIFIHKALDQPFAGILMPIFGVVAGSAVAGFLCLGATIILSGTVGIVLGSCIGFLSIMLSGCLLDRHYDLKLLAQVRHLFPKTVLIR